MVDRRGVPSEYVMKLGTTREVINRVRSIDQCGATEQSLEVRFEGVDGIDHVETILQRCMYIVSLIL